MGITSSFDASQVTGYGDSGIITAQIMREAVTKYCLDLSFDDKIKKFTVLDSSDLLRETIQHIFDEYQYFGWEPLVIDEVDENGNHKVQLQLLPNPIRVNRKLFDEKVNKKLMNVQV